MSGLNDALSADEESALSNFFANDQAVPPADAQEGAPDAPAPDAPEPAEPATLPAPAATPPAPAAEPAPATTPPAEPQQTEDERFAAFQQQHAGKSPEELARLAFQQSQRANGAEARARQANQTAATYQENLRAEQERIERARQAVRDRRASFDQQLEQDPDAATRAMREETDAAELARLDAEEMKVRQDTAIGMATSALPDYFTPNATAIHAFGGEVGYSKEELSAISDGRDLVVLSLANMAATLIKGGMMNTKGELITTPPPVVDPAPTDPRLTTPQPPQTLSSTPARPAASGISAERQATDVLNMSDADFNKLPPAELDALLRQLG